MISIVTPDTMRALEQDVMDDGVTEADLIRRAASGIAGYLARHVAALSVSPPSILAVAGPGNNGVDALVAAAIMAGRGWTAYALLVGRSDLANIPAPVDSSSRIEVVDEIPQVDVILDGIFGNSGRTDLPDNVVSVLEMIAAATRIKPEPLIVAVDCPTGTNTLTGEVAGEIVGADVTLCISNPKIGMLRAPATDHLGELEVLDIGLARSEPDPEVGALLIDGPGVRRALSDRPAGAHKSQVGGLLIVGGAPGYFGAPRLAGEAALRAGCGYVGMAIPRSITSAIASAVPELIYHSMSDADGRRSASTVREALTGSSRYDAMVIGPGLGRDEVASSMLSELFVSRPATSEAEPSATLFGIPRRVEQPVADDGGDISTVPVVLDADALNWLSEQDDWPSLLEDRTCVLTPHVGEMARLLDVDRDEVAADPWAIARQAAQVWGQVIVLKSAMTCVATPDGDVFVTPRPTPELATPGTGDALTGLIGAFIAQGLTRVDAACLALYTGALAGKAARRRYGTRSVIARDVIDGVAAVLRDLEAPAQRRLRADS